MALVKEITQDKIELVGPHRIIQIRTKTAVLEDGVEISASFSRHVISPGDNLTNETQEIKNIAATVHTAAIKTDYAAVKAKTAL